MNYTQCRMKYVNSIVVVAKFGASATLVLISGKSCN
jgi:hypothetical protein